MHLDMLLVNLRMESMFLNEIFNINWVSQAGLVENIEQIVKEYKQSRGLLVMVWSTLFSECGFPFFPNSSGYINMRSNLFR